MQSDDFTFYLKGLALQEHIDFYMTWSGRFIADYISTSILSLNNHLLITLLSALALPLLIYNLATIPCYRESKIANKPLIITIIILWFSYWLCNPALGQTTFWVVGEANYLWPLVFVAFFIKIILKITSQSVISRRQCFLLWVLAFFAGCSNEATGALVLYCLLLIYGWAWLNRLANKKYILISFMIALIGFLILLLAPGNMERAAVAEFANWRAMPLDERISNHLSNVIPSILKGYTIIYLVVAWAFFQARKSIDRLDWQLIVIFSSAVLIFCVILIASPHAQVPRTHITGLFFILITLSIFLKEAFHHGVSRLGKSLFVLLSITFACSYIFILSAYHSFSEQSDFRVKIINHEKSLGKQEVTIPNYYKPFVLRAGDYPELDHHNPYAMGKYYGVEKIGLVFVDFDYVKLRNSPCYINYKELTEVANVVDCIYVQKQKLAGATKFIIKFDSEIAHIENYSTRYKLKVANTFPKTSEYYYEITLPLRIIKIAGDYYASIDTVNNLLALDINSNLIVKIYGPVNTLDGSDSIEIPLQVE